MPPRKRRSADERTRQAEIDAARAREVEEERLEEQRREQEQQAAEEARKRGKFPVIEDVPDLTELYDRVAPKLVRNYIRTTMLPGVLLRMYEMAMGRTLHPTFSPLGALLELEAPPQVQASVLKSLASLAMPTNHTLDQEQPDTLPGVIALGPLDMEHARRQAHGERFISAGPVEAVDVTNEHRAEQPVEDGPPGTHPSMMGEGRVTGDPDAAPLPPMEERIARGEFEVVEIDESPNDERGVRHDPGAEDAEPLGPRIERVLDVPPTPRARKAREILAKRRRTKPSIVKNEQLAGSAHLPHLTDTDA